MFGLDHWIAHFSDGTTLLVVAGVATVLGLRHATDPDHLVAVTTLIASGKRRTARAAARLGLAWGLGHATSLFAFGLPIVLFKAYLPERVQQGAETAIGVVIVVLAAWLLVRWRRGLVHLHATDRTHRHSVRRARSPLQAFAIGLVHGLGGSAGVGVLLLAAIHDRLVAVAALALFAICTAISMAAALDRLRADALERARTPLLRPRCPRSRRRRPLLRGLVRAWGAPGGALHSLTVSHEQAAAYALGALDDQERRDFEEHLAACQACADEIESLQGTASSLAFAGELPPAPGRAARADPRGRRRRARDRRTVPPARSSCR